MRSCPNCKGAERRNCDGLEQRLDKEDFPCHRSTFQTKDGRTARLHACSCKGDMCNGRSPPKRGVQLMGGSGSGGGGGGMVASVLYGSAKADAPAANRGFRFSAVQVVAGMLALGKIV